MRDACLLLFTKPATPGRVKTRLVRDPAGGGEGLTADQAALLHQAFLDDLTRRLAPGRFDLVLAWALEANEDLPAPENENTRQQGGDLGERLFHALSERARKHRLVAAIGSDHPEVELSEIERGFALLRGGVDVVLGPATDGGYYFVGVRSDSLGRRLFSEIEWSTPRVLEATLERCRETSRSVMLLREGSDVDTPTDLARLRRRLGDASDGLAARCPDTAALLRQWSAS